MNLEIDFPLIVRSTMATNPNFSRSSGARGRIAQVLAQARASLQEPSRPVTPLTLDQKTYLSAQLGIMSQSADASDGSSSIHKKLTKKTYEQVSQSYDRQSNKSNDPTAVATERKRTAKEKEPQNRTSPEAKLLLDDFRDCLTNIDLNLSSRSLIDEKEMVEMVQNLKATVDPLIKKFRSKSLIFGKYFIPFISHVLSLFLLFSVFLLIIINYISLW